VWFRWHSALPAELHGVLPQDVNAAGRFVIAFVDADDIVEEANEANNVVVSPQIE
jgi:hypothetical protein